MLENNPKNSSSNELNTKSIKIIDMDKVEDYLFMILDNGQKILTNGKDLYDVSDYDYVSSIFDMQDRFCAVMKKGYALCVVDLKTMDILFEDERAYHISKQDDRTLHIIMKIGGGGDTIYDIETKQYLSSPDNYEFENSLGNNLYVFREHNSDANFYDYKRCVIHANGKILLENVEGWIELNNNHLIIQKKDKICIIKVNEDKTLDMKTLEQDGKIIAKPAYCNGYVILIEKGIVKIYTPDFTPVNEFVIEELNEVIDYEIISNTLKLCLPHTVDGEQVNKHLFINLSTGKRISHFRIEGYPYWMPTTYIGQDYTTSKIKDYHFYNANFETIINVTANSYESVESNKECMFVIKTLRGEKEHKQLLNAENGSIRDVDYDYIHFHTSLPYGYGVNYATETMDFFDENLNIIIPDFDYQKFNLRYSYEGFNYFIVNDYLCIHKHFVGSYGESRWRVIIQKANGEVILNSVQKKCCALGNLIQIIDNEDKKSVFLNTITGEIGPFHITAPTNELGKIDFKNIKNANQILSLENNISYKLLENEEEQNPKVKKLIPEWL